jgi:exonuclease SbcD
MRILHTADWHIGQTLNGWTREAEHGTFLSNLPELEEAYGADALVVAGDIFDCFNPSVGAPVRDGIQTGEALSVRLPRLSSPFKPRSYSR